MNSILQQKTLLMLQEIPKGNVVTYKQLAEKMGIKNPRIIGTYLHKNKDAKTYPCHRVIRSNGTIASGYVFGGKNQQIEKLQKEGIIVNKNRIDLKRFQFHFK